MSDMVIFNGPGSNSLYIPTPPIIEEPKNEVIVFDTPKPNSRYTAPILKNPNCKKEVIVFDNPGSSNLYDKKCEKRDCSNTISEIDEETLTSILEKLKETLIISEFMLSDLLRLKLQNLENSILLEIERVTNNYYTKEGLNTLLESIYYTKELIDLLIEESAGTLFEYISEEQYELTREDLNPDTLYVINKINAEELDWRADTPYEEGIPVGGLLPNVFYNIGEITSPTTINFCCLGRTHTYQEYMFLFTLNGTTQITWDSSIVNWFGGLPELEDGKTYQVSVVNGLGVILEF